MREAQPFQFSPPHDNADAGFKALQAARRSGEAMGGRNARPSPHPSDEGGRPVDGTQYHLQLREFNDPEAWIAAFFRVLIAKASRWRFCVSKVDKDLLLFETSLPLTNRELTDALQRVS